MVAPVIRHALRAGQGGGDVAFVFKNDTIFVFLVILPSAMLAAWLGAPPWVVWACLKSDQILSALSRC